MYWFGFVVYKYKSYKLVNRVWKEMNEYYIFLNSIVYVLNIVFMKLKKSIIVFIKDLKFYFFYYISFLLDVKWVF